MHFNLCTLLFAVVALLALSSSIDAIPVSPVGEAQTQGQGQGQGQESDVLPAESGKPVQKSLVGGVGPNSCPPGTKWSSTLNLCLPNVRYRLGF